jgi:branched-chain amino acid transport system permease protein
MMGLNRTTFVLVLFGIFLLLPLFPRVINPYLLFIFNMFFLYTILSLGLNLLLGYAGQFAFASGAFYGIGAYIVLLLQVKLGCPYWVSLPAAGVITAIIGITVGFPALRLSGLYLAIVTLSFSLLTQWTLIHWHSLTFGAGGHKCPTPNFAPLPLTNEQGMYYLSFFVATLLIIFAWNITRSKIGRAFVALRDSEVAAQSMGINLASYKAIAFGLSAFYAGVAGGLFAAVLKFVAPENFGVYETIAHFAMVVLGGLASIAGSVLGAGIVLFLIESTRGLHTFQEILFGGLIIVSVIFLPSGVYGFIRVRFTGWEEILSRRK